MGRSLVIKNSILGLILLGTIFEASGHGRLLWPPARSTIVRHEEFANLNPPLKDDDMSLNCGGMGVQFWENDGHCGPCGDNYANAKRRDNESGGKFDRQIIVENYTSGQEIDVQVELTVNHKGYFEFRLCEHNKLGTPEEEVCFQKHLLEIVEPIAGNHRTREPVFEGVMKYNVTLQLPEKLTCSQCIIQWHYNTGNSVGDCGDGRWELGCGNQEWFRGCSDISIQ